MSTQENLEERIERIRKRNEELQKRHAEAEADKQRAKKENAMVQTKLKSYDDWPKEHKYDNVDFTFDTYEDEHNVYNDVREKKTERYRKSQFAEGDGPPPDPSYSFLKDADRDFNRSEQTKNKSNPSEKLQWPNQRDMSSQQRGRGSHNRGNFRGNNRGRATRGDFSHHKNDSHPEYDAWRCERNKIDEARINRQRNAEGKWRREWDVEKINNDGPKEITHTHKPDKPTIGDVLLSGARKVPASEPIFDKSKDGNRNRPNIMVSLNRTGEVQSVKVTSPPAIGSGRVGPRQMKSRPLFADEAFKDKRDEFADSHKPRGRVLNGRENKKNDKSRSPKKNEMHQPSGSVQNRLNKYKQPNDFSQLSEELKDVSAEIEGIYNSVENLNKKHGEAEKNNLENFDNGVDISVLIKNHTNAGSEEFSLSTDLVLGSDDVIDYNKSEEDMDLKCSFGDMKTNDIESYIEREVLKNNTCLSPDLKETSENNLIHEAIEDNEKITEISDVAEKNEALEKNVETVVGLEDVDKKELKNREQVGNEVLEKIYDTVIVGNTTVDNKSNTIKSENEVTETKIDENIINETVEFETKSFDLQEKRVENESRVESKADDVENIAVGDSDEMKQKSATRDRINMDENKVVNEVQCQEKVESEPLVDEAMIKAINEDINSEKSKSQIELNNEAILTDNIEKE